MAVYRTIYTTFWTDAKVDDDFSPEDKYFYLYLMTNPHTNICGCYEISMKSMSRELGYDSDTVRKLISRMETEYDVIRYNQSTKEILILNWYKYNWTNSKDLMKSVKNAASQIKCDSFRDYIFALTGDPVGTVATPSHDPGGTSVSVTVNNIPVNNIYNNISSTVDSTIELQETPSEEPFDTFWEAYPKHTNTSKKKAKDAFSKAIRKTDIDTMLKAIEAQKKTDQWKRGFIPMATTWLNGEHWDDEVEIEESQKVYDHESTAYKDARWLSNKINSVNPTIPKKQEDELQKWAYGFELMETVDGHPPLEVLRVMKYSQESEWWRKKVTSPWDIRKNYLKLLREATEKGWFSE